MFKRLRRNRTEWQGQGAAIQETEEEQKIGLSGDNQFARVLVVDDDQMNIEVMSAMLIQEDISFDTAMSGQETLNKVKKRLKHVQDSQGSL